MSTAATYSCLVTRKYVPAAVTYLRGVFKLFSVVSTDVAASRQVAPHDLRVFVYASDPTTHLHSAILSDQRGHGHKCGALSRNLSDWVGCTALSMRTETLEEHSLGLRGCVHV